VRNIPDLVKGFIVQNKANAPEVIKIPIPSIIFMQSETIVSASVVLGKSSMVVLRGRGSYVRVDIV
jgi:hypothetical protein